MRSGNKELLPQAGLLLVTLIWGSAFVVVKNTASTIPASTMIAIRFGMAALLVGVFFWKQLKQLTLAYWKAGAVIGILFYLSYYLQTVGVQYTTAGKNAFLTAVYVVLVPFVYWIVKKRRPGANNVIAAFLCITGIGVLSLKTDFSVNRGDLLSLFCGISFAVQIVATAIFVKKLNPILLAFTQFMCTAIFALFGAFAMEQPVAELNQEVIFSLLYIGVLSTFAALLLQTICQKYVSPSKASLIMSFESVFGCVFGAVFLNEPLSIQTLFGFVLIFAAIILSEVGARRINPLKRASFPMSHSDVPKE